MGHMMKMFLLIGPQIHSKYLPAIPQTVPVCFTALPVSINVFDNFFTV